MKNIKIIAEFIIFAIAFFLVCIPLVLSAIIIGILIHIITLFIVFCLMLIALPIKSTPLALNILELASMITEDVKKFCDSYISTFLKSVNKFFELWADRCKKMLD